MLDYYEKMYKGSVLQFKYKEHVCIRKQKSVSFPPFTIPSTHRHAQRLSLSLSFDHSRTFFISQQINKISAGVPHLRAAGVTRVMTGTTPLYVTVVVVRVSVITATACQHW